MYCEDEFFSLQIGADAGMEEMANSNIIIMVRCGGILVSGEGALGIRNALKRVKVFPTITTGNCRQTDKHQYPIIVLSSVSVQRRARTATRVFLQYVLLSSR